METFTPHHLCNPLIESYFLLVPFSPDLQFLSHKPWLIFLTFLRSSKHFIFHSTFEYSTWLLILLYIFVSCPNLEMHMEWFTSTIIGFFFLLHCYCCCLWWLTHPQGYPCMCKADFWMPDETFNHTRPPVFYDFLSLLETVTLTQRNRRTYTNSRCFFFNCSSRLFTRASVGKPESKNASKFVLVDKWGLIVPGFPSVERGICDRLALREQHNS